MKVVVTGGAGQLGTVVIRRLLANAKVREIVCLDIRPPAVASPRVKSVLCDVRDTSLPRYFTGADTVFHLAFVVTARMARDQMDAINVGGSENVFRAALATHVKQIVYSSSIAAYGVASGHPVPLLEDSPRKLVPSFAYSANKYQVEELLDKLEAAHPETLFTRIRPGILVGTHMDHALGRLLARRMLPPSSAVPMPIVWDEDVADAMVLAFEQRKAGAFNTCAEEPATGAELARAAGYRLVKLPRFLEPLLGLAVRSADPAWLKAAHVVMVQSSAKARAELGWQPRFPTAREVMRHHAAAAPGRFDRRVAMFFSLLRAARVLPVPANARPISARIQLALTGPRGGDIALRFVAGRLRVSRGIPRSPTSVVRLAPETLLGLVGGQTDLATAEATGQLHIEGDPNAVLALQGIVDTFRSHRATRWLAAGLSS